MKTITAAVSLGLAIAIAPILAIAADDVDMSRNQPKSFVKDSAITAKIKASLAATHITTLANLHVETDADGVVWLSGFAHNQKEVDQAVQTARSTEHVVAVKNDIKIKNAE